MRSFEEKEKILKLVEAGLSHSKIAKETSIPRSTVRDIAKRYRGLLSELVDEMDSKSIALSASRFESGGGYHLYPQYAYILGMYLGDGYINKEPRTYKLRIYSHSKDVGIQAKIKQCLESLLPTNKVRIYRQKTANCSEVIVYSNQLPSLFPQLGPGKKSSRKIELLSWQREIVAQNPESFLQGLHHSDGCRYISQGRVFYSFVNTSKDIINLYCNTCNALGIEYTVRNKIQGEGCSPAWVVSLYKKEHVVKAERILGPKF